MFLSTNRRNKCALSGALICSILCLTASPPLTVFVRDHVPHPRLDLEQNPLQDLLDHRPKPLAPVPRSKATLAISFTALSVNNRDAGSTGTGNGSGSTWRGPAGG